MIVEHCYMDSEADRQWLSNIQGLSKLAKADANAIASYYSLIGLNGKKAIAKHAKVLKGTTKGIQMNCFESPKVNRIVLKEYDGVSPGIVTYEVDVTDQAGINALYLIYKNPLGDSVTVSFPLGHSLVTGIYQLKAYIPEYLMQGNYILSYIGAYNQAGYDAGYNRSGNTMVGSGKCDWMNTFDYDGEADFTVETEGSISTAHAKLIDYEIQIGLRNKRNRNEMRIYPN